MSPSTELNPLAAFEPVDVDWTKAVAQASELSYADIATACDAAIKDAILSDAKTVTTELLIGLLDERRMAHE